VRLNTGVPPKLLLDQHLIAEYRELLIPGGQQRKRGWEMTASIPSSFRLGTGHITFWRNKHLYLARRHEALIAEMRVRGFTPNLTYWPLAEIPSEFKADWMPSLNDTLIVRERIIERYLAKPHWYRYYGNPVELEYEHRLIDAEIDY
jgi:deoxyribonuclease (pyrimidine dimer)